MTDSIKLPVEIEYHFRWENPCFKQKIEIFACDEHVARPPTTVSPQSSEPKRNFAGLKR